MSKVLAIWGATGVGKTTFAIKLAQSIYDQYNATVLILFCDNQTPILPVLFPKKKANEVYSVGEAISKATITQEDVIGSIITVGKKQNFGVLGYKDGENKYTYPKYNAEQATAFLNVLKSLADYVVVDCTSELRILSAIAAKTADFVFRLVSPDLKSISFFNSQLPLYSDIDFQAEKNIIGINISENELYLPLQECKMHYKDVSFTLPYSREIKAQMLNGELFSPVSDKKYKEIIRKITERVV